MKGRVKQVNHGMVTTEVSVELDDGEGMVATITKSSAEEQELKVGKE